MIEYLTNENYILVLAKRYDNPQAHSTEEFYEDLKRIKYIKRLLNRYHKTGEVNERLILNHMVVLYNVFGTGATDMLFYKLESEYWSDLKTYLVYLHRMPLETVVSKGIKETEIPLNKELIDALRKL